MQIAEKPLSRADLLRLEAELVRRKYLRDPVAWAKERLGEDLWSKQREIMEAVRDYRRVTVKSCHGVGKSHVVAAIAGWWLDTHPPGEAFVVTSAPTGDQVKAILWRYIGRMFAKGKLPGRVNQTEWFMTMPEGNEEQVAFGRKPSDFNPTAFHGIHARYVLVILDEAAGIDRALWEAGGSLISNEDSKMVAIGNPTDPLSEFADTFKPDSGWHKIKISFFDSPVITGEKIPEHIQKVLVSRVYEQEVLHKFGPESPTYKAKILGEFPDSNDDGLIPLSWIQSAIERGTDIIKNNIPRGTPINLGVDVGAGGDSSTICLRQGIMAEIIHRDRNPDTMNTLGNVMNYVKKFGARTARVDSIGVGKGVVDRAKEQPEWREVVLGINVGSSPTSSKGKKKKKGAIDDQDMANLRAEAYWNLRSLFQSGDIALHPKDELLASQLAAIRYRRTSQGGKLLIESKDEMKARGLASPNDADACMLAFLPGHDGARTKRRLTFGRKRG